MGSNITKLRITFPSKFSGLAPAAQPQYSIIQINNTVGIFYHEKATIKISNNNWVYTILNIIKQTIEKTIS